MEDVACFHCGAKKDCRVDDLNNKEENAAKGQEDKKMTGFGKAVLVKRGSSALTAFGAGIAFPAFSWDTIDTFGMVVCFLFVIAGGFASIYYFRIIIKMNAQENKENKMAKDKMWQEALGSKIDE
jgi:hypothetical protein